MPTKAATLAFGVVETAAHLYVTLCTYVVLSSVVICEGFILVPGIRPPWQSIASSQVNENASDVDQLFNDVAAVASASNDTVSDGDADLTLVAYLGPTNGFFNAVVAAISVILVSEIGDKTFFIAVVLAMKYSRFCVFAGAVAALALMTALSACLGQISVFVPKIYVHYLSVFLFIVFGMKMIKDGCSMPKDDSSEYDEVQKTIENRESKTTSHANGNVVAGETAKRSDEKTRMVRLGLLWVFAEAFAMTFLAEWGDRSQITTIVLAARESISGVIFGAVVGHSICTSLAVLGGAIVAKRISVKAVTIIGGLVFLLFAVWAIFTGSGDEENAQKSGIEPAVIAKSADIYQSAFLTHTS